METDLTAMYSFDELAERAVLKKIRWTKRRMITLHHCGFLDAHFNSSEGLWLTTLVALKQALIVRNQAVNQRLVDPDELTDHDQ